VELAGDLLDCFAAHEELAPDPCNRVHALHPLPPILIQDRQFARVTAAGVKFRCRSPVSEGQHCMPKHTGVPVPWIGDPARNIASARDGVRDPDLRLSAGLDGASAVGVRSHLSADPWTGCILG
jgi:hypothetical protein